MHLNRKLAAVVAALLGTVGVGVVASPANAAIKPVIAGTAICDEDSSSWVVTWTVTNPTETPVAIRQVFAVPVAPVTTFTGIAVGDVLPPASEGSLTGTTVVHSYLPKVASFLAIGLADSTLSTRAQVNLPTVCGTPVKPTVTFESRCDDLLVSVAMPANGYTVPIEVWGTDAMESSFVAEPGAAVRSVPVPSDKAASVKVNIGGVGTVAQSKWAYPASCLPPSAGTFQLFAQANYRYVEADQLDVAASALATSSFGTRFEFRDVGSGDVAIRSVDDSRFLTVAAGDGSVNLGPVRVLGVAEKFRVVGNADGTTSLRSELNGKFVTAERAGQEPLVANRTAIGPWEKFSRYAPNAGPRPIDALINDNYVTAESAGKKPLIANRATAGLWEFFFVQDLGNGEVSLKSLVNGKYVCADHAGKDPLIANRTAVGPWETFKVVKNADGSVSFQSKVNGRYVTAESAGKKPLIANRTAIGPWEKFYTFG
ncbi:hypothetical protein DFJ67_1851 [Asanoa ferruginea]|uniref:Ricin-type beta-trefoil lectin protein n=1 Tax=Asanoa ferruginea TaxID=53367 RepID=A0A3D9ZEM9_9ACTN|nr:RICIN domain-containing protein [Asanoa ferruginea]REF95888.1 hypothetical protein DFJ67_1851 [Asanoa ferruginea]GIF50739.1 hypothetical protein Afe04nite_52780 [Asanoa ferruginea]